MTIVGTDVQPPFVNGAGNGAAEGVAAILVRRRPPAGGYAFDVIETVRRLVVETALPIDAIAEQTGPSASTIKIWIRKYGWTRPEGAPPFSVPRGEFDPDLRRAKLKVRLYRSLGRQLTGLEKRATGKGGETAEKDARTLGLLARTLETLTELDRDDGAKVKQPEPVDRDQLDADLAERIARWAKGGEEI